MENELIAAGNSVEINQNQRSATASPSWKFGVVDHMRDAQVFANTRGLRPGEIQVQVLNTGLIQVWWFQ